MTDEFTRDVMSNVVADGLVALAAFTLAGLAFGLWEHRQQELDALRIARSMLKEELSSNRSELLRVVNGLEARPDAPEAIFMPRPLAFDEGNWEWLRDIAAGTRLPVDLLLSLHKSYDQCTRLASGDWMERASRLYVSGTGRGRGEFRDEALLKFREALQSTEDALDSLGAAPQ
jgi:hypothetical protein